ncbi:2'-5' RNA ligase family protein [Paracoccus sp. PAR01]|uniref:2'-5' RNA ligase family protein n=1 Tax=Paracoccus sp. PAR01 TaxID=2769282 RepID=UPI0017846A88|nr:2'-5' RNA ligase family protein [Paracoccus sp. PAR01]MBD9528346.1 2'-5' RNA ligase family protein [Paracoccus sp. PAR01]
MAYPRNASTSHFFFYAARPPDAVADQMAEVWQLFGTGDKLRRDKLHMTLLPVTDVAEVPEGMVELLLAAGATVRQPSFEMELDRLVTWHHGRGHNNPLVLTTATGRSAGADAVVRALNSALPQELHWPQWRLVPHVTLAYGKGFAEDLILPRPIRWHVDSFNLTESLRGKGRHIPLGTWQLGGAGAEQLDLGLDPRP